MDRIFWSRGRDGWVLKLDSSGNIVWQKTYSGQGEDSISSIQQTSGGDYIAAGFTTILGTGDKDFWVYKLDTNGNLIWDKAYGEAGYDYEAASIQQTPDDGYIVAGKRKLSEADPEEAIVLKLDSSGNIIWKKLYASDEGYQQYGGNLHSIRQTQDGGYIATGWTGTLKFWILKLDANGDVFWQNTYAGKYQGYATSVQQTIDGGYVAAGLLESENFGAGKSDFCVLRTDSNGDISGYDILETTIIQTSISDLESQIIDHTVYDTNATAIDSSLYAIDTSIHPYYLVPAEIHLKQGDIELPESTGVYNYSGVHLGESKIVTFTIENLGTAPLELTGSPTIQINEGVHDFSITRQPSKETVGIDEPVTFDIMFSPTTPDVQTATVLIESNDRNNNPYAFTIFGRASRDGAPFAAVYGGQSWDSAYSIQQTTDDGYIVAGETWSFGNSQPGDIWILKLDKDGVVSWQKTYGGSGNEQTSFIQQTTDGGYIVAGVTSSWSEYYDIWIFKLDRNGNMEWEKTYGKSHDPFTPYSIWQTTDGGYIVAKDNSAYDLWVAKLDNAGNIEWQKTYGGTSFDSARSILQTESGDYVVAGTTYSFGEGKQDVWILRLDIQGNVIWQKTYGGTSYDLARAIQQTDDNGFIVAGSTVSSGISGYCAWLFKLDQNGNMLWQKAYDSSEYYDHLYSVQPTTDGGYIATGEIGLLKFDSQGELLWQKSFGGNLVQQTSEGGYIVAGSTSDFGAGYTDIFLFKVDESGQIEDCYLSGSPDGKLVAVETSITTTTVTGQPASTVIKSTDAQVLYTSTYPDFICETPLLYTLTVNKTGNGVVTSTPAGIDCGIDCSEPYNPDTNVTLTANPDVGSTFTGWSGGGCSGTGDCTITMNTDTTITAAFSSTGICGGADEVLDYTIQAGETVNCRATNSIRLAPGFHAEEGCTFRGYIGE